MDERFCPNCGSTHVEPDTSNGWAMATFGGNPNQWMCRECDYTGFMPSGNPEEDFAKEEDIEFEPGEKYNRVDLEATPKFLTQFAAILIISGGIILLYLSL